MAKRAAKANERTNLNRARRTSRVRQRPLTWNADVAYAVGLAATDGSLARTGRHISFVSRDLQQVESFLRCVNRPGASIRKDGEAYRAYFGDVELYGWLTAAGLTPRKSLTLQGLTLPDELFLHCVRGLLDGDGSIAHYVHEPNLRKYPNYRYRRLYVRFYSASRDHLTWLRAQLHSRLGIRGALLRLQREAKHDLFELRYAKHASISLLTQLYEDPGSPRLVRKWNIWEDFKEQPVVTRPYRRHRGGPEST